MYRPILPVARIARRRPRGSPSPRMALLLALAVAVPLASGCATSGALTLISLGASGISYAATGKSLSDHALSMVLERDCAALRLLDGEAPCRAPETAVLVAAGDAPLDARGSRRPVAEIPSAPAPIPGPPGAGLPSRSYERAPTGAATVPLQLVTASAADRGSPPAPAPGARPGVREAARVAVVSESTGQVAGKREEGGARTFLVLGSFGRPENAERFRLRQGAGAGGRLLPIRIVTSRVGGAERYRVVAGPVPEAGLPGAPSLPPFEGAGGKPWRLALCLPTLAPPPCVPAPGRGPGPGATLAEGRQPVIGRLFAGG